MPSTICWPRWWLWTITTNQYFHDGLKTRYVIIPTKVSRCGDNRSGNCDDDESANDYDDVCRTIVYDESVDKGQSWQRVRYTDVITMTVALFQFARVHNRYWRRREGENQSLVQTTMIQKEIDDDDNLIKIYKCIESAKVTFATNRESTHMEIMKNRNLERARANWGWWEKARRWTTMKTPPEMTSVSVRWPSVHDGPQQTIHVSPGVCQEIRNDNREEGGAAYVQVVTCILKQ